MKLNTLTALLIILFGIVLVITGSVLLWRGSAFADYALMGGLIIVFIGYVLFVIRFFHKR